MRRIELWLFSQLCLKKTGVELNGLVAEVLDITGGKLSGYFKGAADVKIPGRQVSEARTKLTQNGFQMSDQLFVRSGKQVPRILLKRAL